MEVDTQAPFLLSELDIISPEDEAREFLRLHDKPATIDIRYGICTDYEAGIYDARTAFFHLVDHGGLKSPEELMRVICAGVKALGSDQ
jgi:hypothetical protein